MDQKNILIPQNLVQDIRIICKERTYSPILWFGCYYHGNALTFGLRDTIAIPHQRSDEKTVELLPNALKDMNLTEKINVVGLCIPEDQGSSLPSYVLAIGKELEIFGLSEGHIVYIVASKNTFDCYYENKPIPHRSFNDPLDKRTDEWRVELARKIH